MPIDLLKKLVQIPSVNPMGKEGDPSICYESRMTDFLVQFFGDAGIEYEVVEVESGRCNVLAFLEGQRNSIVLMDAHQDTVPVENMTIDPFVPREQNGRIYGRGACDVKGGLATMLSVAVEMSKVNPKDRPSLLLTCTCDEEHAEKGIFHLVDCLTQQRQASKIIKQLDRKPSVALVFEPTGLNVVSAHRGTVRWKIRTTGKASHSAEPEKGENAIYKMSELVSLLSQYSTTELPESHSHPLLGRPTLSVGRIEGGTSVNIVPEFCEIEIDRRLIPGDDPKQAMQAVADFLHERVQFDFEMESPWMIAPPLSDDNNDVYSSSLLSSVENFAIGKQIIGVPFGTHAARLAGAGVPSIVFGPGSIEQAHTKDEWVPAKELELAKQILVDYLTNKLPQMKLADD